MTITDNEEQAGCREYRVILTALGPDKINTIRQLRKVTTLGLREAKDLVENVQLPCVLLDCVDLDTAVELRDALAVAEAKVEVVESYAPQPTVIDTRKDHFKGSTHNKDIFKPLDPDAGVNWRPAVTRIVYLGLMLYLFTAPAPDGARSSVNSGSATSVFWVILQYILAALLTIGLILPLTKAEGRKYLVFFRRIRPLMVLQNILVIAVVASFVVIIDKLMPFLDRSWLYRYPVTGGKATNITILPLSIAFIGMFYAVLFTLSLPWLAHSEEMSFRNGTRNWTEASLRSLHFGLTHCIVGVPIYIGIALSIGGLWLSYQYFKGGVERSTTHHLTYNLIIILGLVAYMLTNGMRL